MNYCRPEERILERGKLKFSNLVEGANRKAPITRETVFRRGGRHVICAAASWFGWKKFPEPASPVGSFACRLEAFFCWHWIFAYACMRFIPEITMCCDEKKEYWKNISFDGMRLALVAGKRAVVPEEVWK